MTCSAFKTRLAAAAAMALALAACDARNARNDAPAAAPLPVLDASSTLPYAPPAPVERYVPQRGYRLAERAYGVQRAVYETPPDYGFSYGEEEPLAWETADDWAVYAEPWDDGYRYYYYEPGGAYPYFIRDDDYGYGYNAGGVLVVVVDARGRYLPVEDFRRVAPLAGRYYARGHDIRTAGLRAQRIPVDERAWSARAPRVTRSAEQWLTAAREDRDWRRWREADRGRELDRFTGEQLRRADAQRTRFAERDRQDRRREFDDRRLQQEQARSAERNARDAMAREADRRQEADQQARVQAERQRREQQLAEQGRAHQADVARAEHQRRDAQQAQQAQAERQRREQQLAEQGRAHQADVARAEHQRRDAQQAQQAQAERQRQDQQRAEQGRAHQAEQAQAQRQQQEARQAEQAQARAAQQQARSAEQAARVAAARERAAPKAEPPAKGPQKPHGKPGDKDDGKDRKD